METLADSTHQDVTTAATWQSSNAFVATVSNAGVLTGVGVGSAIVTVTNGDVIATLVVVVDTETIAGVTIAGTTSLNLGQTAQLSAILNYRDASTVDVTGGTTWSTSDGSIATITSSGVLTSLAAGTATITATFQGRVGTATITSTDPNATTTRLVP